MRHRTRSEGFTLLEVLIAIGILAIGMVTIFTLFPIGVFAVKETVEGTRAGNLASSARCLMAAERADVRITDSLSQTRDSAHGGYLTAGPWEVPGDVGTFRDCIYQYVSGTGIVNRIVFDERRMIPITLTATRIASAGVITLLPSAGFTRDIDTLYRVTQQFDFNKWEVYVKVGQFWYRITGVTPSGSGHLSLTEIDVDVTGRTLAAMPSGGKIQILFPVALREPPVDVPQEWCAGFLDRTTNGTNDVPLTDPYRNLPPSMNRNLSSYLCGGGNSANRGGWISLNSTGDWVQISDASGAPAKLSLDTPPSPAPTQPESFNLLFPVVTFDGLHEGMEAAGTLLVEVVKDATDVTKVAGGGQTLSQLDNGASIEVVFDGGTADFLPFDITNNPTGVTVLNVAPNSATSALIVPGNFIRMDGHDYEIATGIGTNTYFDLNTPVPNLGLQHYFNIVLGCDATVAGNVHVPARFPVTKVTRAPPVGGHVVSFDVGPDANGQLPTYLIPMAHSGNRFDNPVHVLPRNPSRFSYAVSLRQQELAGVFASGSLSVSAPSKTVADNSSPIFPGADYPLDPNVVAGGSGGVPIFTLYTLSSALKDAGGMYKYGDLQGMSTGTTIQMAASLSFDGAEPLHLLDNNGILSEGPTDSLQLGAGTLATGSPATVNLTSTKAEYLPFAVAGTWVNVVSATTNADARVVSYNSATAVLTIDNSGSLSNGDSVTVTIAQTGQPNPNPARTAGVFLKGSNVVQATALGLPCSATATKRYNLAVGDFILAPDSNYYAVKAIQVGKNPTFSDYFLILDRAYEGPPSSDYAVGDSFQYLSPIPETYTAQTAVFSGYSITPLLGADASNPRANAARFYNTSGVGTVALVNPLPSGIRAGNYIRADGDADHNVQSAGQELGAGDALDGDSRWYMIDSISASRLTIRLTTTYKGYDRNNAADLQPASVATTIVKTYDTTVGAF